MLSHDELHIDLKVWMDKILSIYWITIGLAFIGQMFGFFMSQAYQLRPPVGFLVGQVFVPSGVQVVLIAFVQYLVKVKGLYKPKMLTIFGTLAAWMTAYSHASVPGLQVLFVILLAVNLIYFNKNELRFSFIVNLIALTSLYLIPDVRESATVYERFAYLFILVAAYQVFSLVLDRGNDILDVLKRSNEQERSLMVRSAMMERLTKVDPLTELYNHRTFYEYLDFLYDQSIHYNMPLQLAIIDIDNFKKVNDEFGHDVGDIILKRVARVIEDSVTENEIVARYGGEEFAVLITSKSINDGYELIESIRKKIANVRNDEINRPITVSIGFQPLSKDLSQTQFFKRADELLYQAKQNGKNQVAVSI
jgi:diguanylate cyclase (GGDEF)-like protein